MDFFLEQKGLQFQGELYPTKLNNAQEESNAQNYKTTSGRNCLRSICSGYPYMSYFKLVGIIALCGVFMIMGILAGQKSQLDAMRDAYGICLTEDKEACRSASESTGTELVCNDDYCWMEVL